MFNAPVFIERKKRGYEDNVCIDQKSERRGPAERRVLTTMMQNVFEPSSVSPTNTNNGRKVNINIYVNYIYIC